MKLVVAGATGFVATEVIRQALRHPAITSVVGLARKPVQIPKTNDVEDKRTDWSKFTSLSLEEWTEDYPGVVVEHLRGADACVWCLAVVPSKSVDMDFMEVSRVCHDYTIKGIRSISSVASRPFRFVYVSGILIERDQSKPLPFLADYRHMRGRVENELLEFASHHGPDIQVAVAKPAWIDGPGRVSTMNDQTRDVRNIIEVQRSREFIPVD